MTLATYVQLGEYIDYTPSADVAAGDVVVQGNLVGIATRAISSGNLGALAVSGVYDVTKESATTFSAGDYVYWDATNSVAVTTDGGGSNKLMGKATADAASGDTTVRVRLSQ